MNTYDLLVALTAKTDLEILEELGPCEGSFAVLELVRSLRALLAS